MALAKNVLGLALVGLASSAGAQLFTGELEKVNTARANELSFRCTGNFGAGNRTLSVVLDPTTNLMTADLQDDEVRVKGVATETFDKKTGITHYFLQGGSEPYSQRLTLAVKDNGKWARFSKTFGATEFICEL